MEKIENYKNYFNIKIIIVGELKVYKNKIKYNNIYNNYF